MLLGQLDFLRQLPLALVELVAALGHDLVPRNPLAVDLAIAQGVAGLGVVGIQLDHPPQVHLALCRRAVLPAPLGQLPLGRRRVGIGGPNPLVLGLFGTRAENLSHLGGLERYLGAVGRLDDVLLPRRLVTVEQLAHHPAAAGQHKDVGLGAVDGREEHQNYRCPGDDPVHGDWYADPSGRRLVGR